MNSLQLILLFAHVCRFFSSRKPERNLCENYAHVSGLDPALPLYMSGDQDTHLSAGDAKFVGMTFLSSQNLWLSGSTSIFAFSISNSIADVIHTDGGFLGIPWVSCDRRFDESSGNHHKFSF